MEAEGLRIAGMGFWMGRSGRHAEGQTHEREIPAHQTTYWFDATPNIHVDKYIHLILN